MTAQNRPGLFVNRSSKNAWKKLSFRSFRNFHVCSHFQTSKNTDGCVDMMNLKLNCSLCNVPFVDCNNSLSRRLLFLLPVSRDESFCRPSPKERLAGSLPGGKTSFCLTGCVHTADLPIWQTCPCIRPRAGHSVNQSSPHSSSSSELPSEEDASALHPVGQRIQLHPGWDHPVEWENLWAAQTGVSSEGGPVWGPRLPCYWLFTLLQPEGSCWD